MLPFRYFSKGNKVPFIEVEANRILEITVTSIFACALLVAKATCYTLARTLWELLAPAFKKDQFSVHCAEHCPTLYKIRQGKLGIFSSNFCQSCRHQHNAITLTDTLLAEGAHVLSHLIDILQEPWLRILGIQPFCCRKLFHLTSNAPILAGQLMCLSLKLALQMFQQVKFDSTSVHAQWALQKQRFREREFSTFRTPLPLKKIPPLLKTSSEM